MTLFHVSMLEEIARGVLYLTRAKKNSVNIIFLLFAALSRATIYIGKAIKEASVSIFIIAT